MLKNWQDWVLLTTFLTPSQINMGTHRPSSHQLERKSLQCLNREVFSPLPAEIPVVLLRCSAAKASGAICASKPRESTHKYLEQLRCCSAFSLARNSVAPLLDINTSRGLKIQIFLFFKVAKKFSRCADCISTGVFVPCN